MVKAWCVGNQCARRQCPLGLVNSIQEFSVRSGDSSQREMHYQYLTLKFLIFCDRK